MRLQKCPRNRTVESRGRPPPKQTDLVTLRPEGAGIVNSYFPSLDPTSRTTISFSAGMFTGGAVIVISGGRSSTVSFNQPNSSLDVAWTVNRNGVLTGIGVCPR